MSDSQTLAVYNEQTEDYAAIMEVEAARDPMITRFIEACPGGGRVLDLGCGAGHYAKRMAEAGLRVDAIDAAEAMVSITSQLSGVTARLGTFDDLNGENIYDGIWAYFSLLHAERRDLPKHLNKIAHSLRPGGVFFMGMKQGTGGKRDHLNRYYEYYEQDELEALVIEAGLTPADVWFGRAAGLAGHPEGWIVIRANA